MQTRPLPPLIVEPERLHAALCEGLGIDNERGSKAAVARELSRRLGIDLTVQRYRAIRVGQTGSRWPTIAGWLRVAGVPFVTYPDRVEIGVACGS